MKRSERPQRTYFIQRGENGPIKIGITTNVMRRVADLATGSAEPLRILAVLEGDFEGALHLRHRADRLAGEWFRPSEAVLAEVALAQRIELEKTEERLKDGPRKRGRWVPKVEPVPGGSLAHKIMCGCISRALKG